MLIILGILVIGIIAGVILEEKGNYCNGAILYTLSGTVLFLILLIFLLFYNYELSNIQSYYAVKETVESVRNRDNISEFENVALSQNIIEINTWLKKAQYWNGTIFDIAIPDKVMELELLK